MKKTLLNIRFYLSEAWKYDKIMCICMAVQAIINGFIPPLSSLLYRNIISSVENRSFQNLVIWVLAECILLLLIRLILKYMNLFLVDLKSEIFKSTLSFKTWAKAASLDLKVSADPNVSTLRVRANEAVGRNIGISYIRQFFQAVTAIITIVSISTILITVSPWAILIILIISLLNIPLMLQEKNVRYDTSVKMAPINKKVTYYAQMLTDPLYEKEMRMYSISDWVINKFKKLIGDMKDIFDGLYKNMFKSQNKRSLFERMQSVFMYLFLGWQVIFENMSFSNFTMFITALGSFSSSLQSLYNAFISINESSLYGDALRQYLSLENDIAVDGKGDCMPESNEKPILRFSHVDFMYPGNDKLVLRDVNAVFEQGKKYVIVGKNGGGKTTLCNLLCRLYDACNGEIAYYGRNIRDINYREYRDEIGMVFQDYKYYDLTIAENIAMNEYDGSDIIRTRILECLTAVGLYEKISSLPNGMDTQLGRLFDDNGILLSGGETQKLAVAKMLFRNSSIVILDEPSSALDPFAENELLEIFKSALADKTVFYVSHRLSIAKHADAIIFVNNNTIENILPHDELMKANAEYAEMYELQASQYSA